MNPSFESGDRSTALMDSHLWNLEQCWKNLKELDSTFYISLSCQMSSVLMWGHYANSHKGVCLVFKIPVNVMQDRFVSRIQCRKLHLVPMLYRDERILVRDYVTEIRNDAIEYRLGDLKRHLISYKPKDWSYEREFRLVIPSDVLKYETGAIYFGPFRKSSGSNTWQRLSTVRRMYTSPLLHRRLWKASYSISV